ncbi:isochorismatase family protein, partial [Nostoc sp. NIES-2111]
LEGHRHDMAELASLHVHHADGVRALAQLARALALPSFASVIPAGPNGAPPLIAEISEELPGIGVDIRQTFGAFGSLKAQWPEPAESPIVIVAGVLTESAVLRTVLEARGGGCDVHVVLDACAGLSERTEAAAIRQIEAQGGVTTSLASLAAGFVQDLSLPAGREVLSILRGVLNR